MKNKKMGITANKQRIFGKKALSLYLDLIATAVESLLVTTILNQNNEHVTKRTTNRTVSRRVSHQGQPLL